MMTETYRTKAFAERAGVMVRTLHHYERSASLSLNFSADNEVDVLAERARSVAPVSASSVAEPVDTPWNTRDLHVIDPAGNQLIFTGRQPNPDPEQASRWKTIFEQSRTQGY